MKRILGCILLLMFVTCAPTFAKEFTLTSPQLSPDGTMQEEQVFNGFGCSGKNISPQLDWFGAPEGTKSFALTVFDPDAPTGSGWWHWVVFNIPATVHGLPLGMNQETLPVGTIQSRTDFGATGYGGACPPVGEKPHRYQFTVWALDVATLPLDQDAPGAMVGYYIHSHQLGKAEVSVTYGR
ncbi:YbhB/YbcL family Raf kinase inhibitor-like protein [Desulfogranum japonicum]|uniref:YbhB/YbcL family Raf kinase inhibitor-like protein n=1 Tax=Desulfogranum japonicum TaxID=231447 RepID=UPI0004286593|nr:YbhB/YbcL family Raf kinase inhibitor-like protein [Desulfogranum japonicum]